MASKQHLNNRKLWLVQGVKLATIIKWIRIQVRNHMDLLGNMSQISNLHLQG